MVKKNKKRKSKILFIISAIFIIVGCYLVGYIVSDYIGVQKISKKGDNVISEFELKVESQKEKNKDNTDEDGSFNEDVDLLGMLQSAFQNEDVVGYLYFPEANISYPIVQGSTNEEYLRKDIYGSYSISGSIFLDSDNSMDFSDVSSIIYGHHMRNGSMFGSLENTLSGGFEGRSFTIYTRDKKLTYDVVSAKPVQPDLRSKYLVKDVAGLKDFISELSSGAYIKSGNEENFVTLLTCHYVNRNTIRYAVTGCLSMEEVY